MGEFIKMWFVEHHSQEENLSFLRFPEQVCSDCYLSQADICDSVKAWLLQERPSQREDII